MKVDLDKYQNKAVNINEKNVNKKTAFWQFLFI